MDLKRILEVITGTGKHYLPLKDSPYPEQTAQDAAFFSMYPNVPIWAQPEEPDNPFKRAREEDARSRADAEAERQWREEQSLSFEGEPFPDPMSPQGQKILRMILDENPTKPAWRVKHKIHNAYMDHYREANDMPPFTKAGLRFPPDPNADLDRITPPRKTYPTWPKVKPAEDWLSRETQEYMMRDRSIPTPSPDYSPLRNK